MSIDLPPAEGRHSAETRGGSSSWLSARARSLWPADMSDALIYLKIAAPYIPGIVGDQAKS
jgi:hypothetical protein